MKIKPTFTTKFSWHNVTVWFSLIVAVIATAVLMLGAFALNYP